MIDLIDRSEVLYKFAEILPEADSLDWYEQAKPDEVKDLVDELYSIVLNVNRIDAEPVKQGNWNVIEEYFDKEEHEEKIDFQCSKCSMIYTLTKNRAMPNYCEHCGSKNVRCEYG